MKYRLSGDIMSVRAVEDSIRATKKYTKGAFSKPIKHPIQGEDFPSRILTEYYEVYPDVEEVTWDLFSPEFWSWLRTRHVDVRFQYDYRQNMALMQVHGGEKAMTALNKAVPGFAEAVSGIPRQM